MKLSQLKTSDQVLAEQLESNNEFRAEWERTALALHRDRGASPPD